MADCQSTCEANAESDVDCYRRPCPNPLDFSEHAKRLLDDRRSDLREFAEKRVADSRGYFGVNRRPPRTLHLVVACAFLVSGCVSDVPPPYLSGNQVSLTEPAVVSIARVDKFGLRYGWRINVNGTDIGSLSEDEYCSFITTAPALSFSADVEGGGLLVSQSFAFSLLLTPIILPFVIPRITSDRYEPMSPQVMYVEDGDHLFLLLGGDTSPILTVEDEAAWASETSGMDEEECTSP